MNKRFYKSFVVEKRTEFLSTIIPTNIGLEMKIGDACADSASILLDKIRDKRNSPRYESFFSTSGDNIYKFIERSNQEEVKFTVEVLNTFLCFFFYKKPKNYFYSEQHTKAHLKSFFSHITIEKGRQNDIQGFNRFLDDLALIEEHLTPIYHAFSIELNENFEFSIIENEHINSDNKKIEETPEVIDIPSDNTIIEVNSAEIRAKKLNIVTQPRELPKKLTTLPITNSRNVYGLKDQIDELRTLLFEEQQSVLIKGIQGAGKTTLVASYVFTHFDDYDHFLYLDVADTSLLEVLKNHRELRRSLDIDKNLTDPEDIFEEIVHSLKGLAGSKKLLIVNNADNNIINHLDRLPAQPDWHLIVLSVSVIENLYLFELPTLKKEDVISMYNSSCNVSLEEEIIYNLYECCGKHIATFKSVIQVIQSNGFKTKSIHDLVYRKSYRSVYTFSKDSPDIQKLLKDNTNYIKISAFSEITQKLSFLFACLPSKPYELSFINAFTEKILTDYGTSVTLKDMVNEGLLNHVNDQSYEMPKIIQQYILENIPNQQETLYSIIDHINSKLELSYTTDLEQMMSEDEYLMDYPSFVERIFDCVELGYLDQHNLEILDYSMLFYSLVISYSSYGVHNRASDFIERLFEYIESTKREIDNTLKFAFTIHQSNEYKELHKLDDAKKSSLKAFKIFETNFDDSYLPFIAPSLFLMVELKMITEAKSMMGFVNQKLIENESFRSLINTKDIERKMNILSYISNSKYEQALELIGPNDNSSTDLTDIQKIVFGKTELLKATCLEKLEKYKDAERAYARAGNIFSVKTSKHNTLCYLGQARCYLALQEFSSAEFMTHHIPFWNQSNRYSVEAFKPVIDFLSGKITYFKGEYEKSHNSLNSALPWYLKRYGKNHLNVAEVLLFRSRALEQLIDWKLAVPNQLKKTYQSEITDKAYADAADALEIYQKHATSQAKRIELKSRMDKILLAGFTVDHKGKKGMYVWKRKKS